MSALIAGIDRLNELVGRGVSWLVLGMVLVGAFNAVARYLGRYADVALSSNAWIELQWYLFSLVFLLAAADTLRKDAHVRVDVFYGRLTERGKAIIDLAGSILFLLPFCVFMLIFSWPAVRNSVSVLEQSPDPGGLPRYPLKAMILAAFVLLFLQGIAELLRNVQKLRNPSEADDGG